MTKSYYIKFIPTPGANGSLIEYRETTQTDWITPSVPANPTTLSQYPLELEQGKSYYISVSAVSLSCSKQKAIITVSVPEAPKVPCCPDGYTMSADNSSCYKEETTAPDITTSGMCFAFSKKNAAYSGNGAWIYDPGYDIHLSLDSTHRLINNEYWTGNPNGYGDESNPGSLTNESVMNRDSVWVDSDCNGNKDPLETCTLLQFTYFINLDSSRRVYIGISGDNTFRIDINNKTIVRCEQGEQDDCAPAPPAGNDGVVVNFIVWHIIPVDLQAGPNYINFGSMGDGSVNDAFAAIIYDNTADEIIAARSDSDLKIIFRTGDIKGQRIDLAECPPGWQLDTSGGIGHYVCRKVTNVPIQTC
ncbi:hypothetical protein HGH93_21415 [Chitinophaga polysaccharea]|uniref:hypothetical protein n=1 Tax=Chitinophaga polysaccharea TaxID=1293035 RepID=UPI001455C5BD|nr:hypothetical protein [Chitinophaga polysaccharea]NLR60683.1 hypothetical protein [Chitinophaga polysaccharea]